MRSIPPKQTAPSAFVMRARPVLVVLTGIVLLAAGAARSQKPQGEGSVSGSLSDLKNPVPYTRTSIAQGRGIYIRATCQECHDLDGRALAGSDMAEAADLTDTRSWKFGTTDGHIFGAIRDGTPGQMPGLGDKLRDDQIWRLVNYIRSIGPKSLRPALVEAATAGKEEAPDDGKVLDPEKLKSPIAYSRKSIARGRSIYIRATCQECHDLDGRALAGSDLAEAADLTDPRSWKWGKTEGHIFAAIRDGTRGQMPGFKDKLDDERIWHLVNYVRSIGPRSDRPKIVEDAQSIERP